MPQLPRDQSTHTSAVSWWRLTNVVAFVVVLVANALTATGKLSGVSIGAMANRYTSYFLPADYVFGIWSVIYIGLVSFVGYQSLARPESLRVVQRIGPWWMVSCLLNSAWVTLFSFSQFGLALLVMLALLATLVAINERIAPLRAHGSSAARWTVVHPFGMYVAWISVAVITNTFQFAHVMQWSVGGIDERVWSVIMMGVATLLGWLMLFSKRITAFPFVVAWAIWGIGERFRDVPLVSDAAMVAALLGIVGGFVGMWRGTVRVRAAA